MATMADILGISLDAETAVDSVSNLPLWLNPDEEEVRADLIHQSIDGSLSIRKGKFKLEMCPGSGGWSEPKPGEEPEGAPSFQLYDLSEDIGERKNVIEEYPEEMCIRDRQKEPVKVFSGKGRQRLALYMKRCWMN